MNPDLDSLDHICVAVLGRRRAKATLPTFDEVVRKLQVFQLQLLDVVNHLVGATQPPVFL